MQSAFLDEPTVGLDPQTRSNIWSYTNELRAREHITMFLTMDYPDDAGGHARSRPPCHFVEQSIQASAQLAEIGASLPGRRSGRGNYVPGSWPRPVAAPPVVGQAAH